MIKGTTMSGAIASTIYRALFVNWAPVKDVDLLQHELQQHHAHMVKQDERKRRRIRWELEAEDARTRAITRRPFLTMRATA